jgi:hypothetical protein
MNKTRIALVLAELLALVVLKVVYELKKKGKLPLGSRVTSLNGKRPFQATSTARRRAPPIGGVWQPPPRQTAPGETR